MPSTQTTSNVACFARVGCEAVLLAGLLPSHARSQNRESSSNLFLMQERRPSEQISSQPSMQEQQNCSSAGAQDLAADSQLFPAWLTQQVMHAVLLKGCYSASADPDYLRCVSTGHLCIRGVKYTPASQASCIKSGVPRAPRSHVQSAS